MQLILEKVADAKVIETKSCEIDFVTETDQEVEKLLIDNLTKDFPTHLFIGEESIANGAQCILTDSPTWIIDPIDGTMNFVHKFPHSCISLALFINKLPEIGIVYNPHLEQFFSARKGKGAYLNDQRIHVSKETQLSQALVMMESGTSRDAEKQNVIAQNHEILLKKVHG